MYFPIHTTLCMIVYSFVNPAHYHMFSACINGHYRWYFSCKCEGRTSSLPLYNCSIIGLWPHIPVETCRGERDE